jgi:WD40 repeat protein
VTRAWSTADGNLVAELPGNENVHSLIFQPERNDDVLAVSGQTARLWRISEHREVFGFKHDGEINAAAFTKDGAFVATGGDKPFLQIWRTADGAPAGPPLPHGREVTEVQFGGQVIATVADGRAFVWTSDGRQLFQGPLKTSAPVSKLRFSPDGLRIFTGTDDGQIQTWSALSGSAIGEPVREREPIISLTASPDNLHILAATAENTVRCWLVPTLRPLGFELHHPGAVENMVVSRDGRQLATVCADGKSRVWNAQNGNLTIPALGHPGAAVAVAMSGDAKYVATGGADATVRLWDASSGAAVATPIKFDTTLAQLSFNPSGSNLLAASQSGLVRIFAVPELRQVGENAAHRTGICFAGFANDGTAVVAGIDGKVEIEKPSGGWTGVAAQPGQGLTATAISKDGQFIATASGGNGQIWNAHTGKKVGEPFQHKAAITALCFSADNRYLITASDDHTAVLWNVKSGRPAFGALMHAKPVCAVAVSDDSARLATGAEDGAVRVWDLATGQALSETLRQGGPIRSLVFADQYSLLSASNDGSIMMWDIHSDLDSNDYPELSTFARALASSTLTDSGRLSWKPPSTIDQLRQLSSHTSGMKTFLDWFFSDRTTRHLTPFSRWTVNDYVANLLQSNSPNAEQIADLIMAGKHEAINSANQPKHP